jgi:hypothetical protein
MILLFALAGVAIVLAVVEWPFRLSRRLFGVIGAALVLVGASAIAYTEWRYLPAANKPLDMTLPLDHARTIISPPFALDQASPYDIWLEVDRTPGVEAFGCLTAEPGFEKLCPARQPELDLGWIVSDKDGPIARGGSDLPAWNRRRAAVAPPDAAEALRKFRDYVAKTQNPSDATPLYHLVGSFHGSEGRVLWLSVDLRRPVPELAAAHPRLVVGLSAAATRGQGLLVTLFCVLCLVGGGFMLLKALVPRKAAT